MVREMALKLSQMSSDIEVKSAFGDFNVGGVNDHMNEIGLKMREIVESLVAVGTTIGDDIHKWEIHEARMRGDDWKANLLAEKESDDDK